MRSRVLETTTERVEADAPLARKASGEVLDELLLLEMELFRRYEAHLASQVRASRPAAPASPEKERILRALCKLDG